MSDITRKALVKATALVPCSVRAFALEAGFDPSFYSKMMSGDKHCPVVALDKVEAALQNWRNDCASAIEIIQQARIDHKEKYGDLP